MTEKLLDGISAPLQVPLTELQVLKVAAELGLYPHHYFHNWRFGRAPSFTIVPGDLGRLTDFGQAWEILEQGNEQVGPSLNLYMVTC